MGKQYVTGFLINFLLDQVVLIKKNRPEWQAGKFNGVGGKVELTDASIGDAMAREFWEEAGARQLEWTHYATLHNIENDHIVHYFVAVDNKRDLKSVVSTKTDEEIQVCSLFSMVSHFYGSPDFSIFSTPNIPWLMAMASAFAPPRHLTRPEEVLKIEGWWKTGQKD